MCHPPSAQATGRNTKPLAKMIAKWAGPYPHRARAGGYRIRGGGRVAHIRSGKISAVGRAICCQGQYRCCWNVDNGGLPGIRLHGCDDGIRRAKATRCRRPADRQDKSRPIRDRTRRHPAPIPGAKERLPRRLCSGRIERRLGRCGRPRHRNVRVRDGHGRLKPGACRPKQHCRSEAVATVSGSGVVPACRTLDTISVFAGTVADADRAFRVMASFDPKDAYSRSLPVPLPPGALPPGLRVGVPDAGSRRFAGDLISEAAFDAALADLSSVTGSTKPTPVDMTALFDVAHLLYSGPWVAERCHSVWT